MKALLFLISLVISCSCLAKGPSLKRLKPTPMNAKNQLDKMIAKEQAASAASFSKGTCVLGNGMTHQVGDFDSHADCTSRGGTIVEGNPLADKNGENSFSKEL